MLTHLTAAPRSLIPLDQPSPVSLRRALTSTLRAAHRWDARLAHRVWARRSPGAVRAARLVGALGDPLVAGATVTAITLASRDVAPAVVVGTGAAVRHAGMRRIARPRPPAPWRLVPTDGASLPSKHTTLAVLAAGAAIRAVPAPPAARYAVPAAIGLAVGAARVTVGAHWPGDVAAGIGFGLAWWWLADHITGRHT